MSAMFCNKVDDETLFLETRVTCKGILDQRRHQDDKGRSLELLANEVERLTLVEVQKYFLKGDVDAGCDLLSQWEQYIELSKTDHNNEVTETLASTIELCSKRVKALQNVIIALPEKQCASDLKEKLNHLENRFAKTKPGSGGGTFEWVDSVLVKCLREGSWLMLDNVNMCSPAVLDRLNGLLEPGGELVIGERGVAPDGSLVTVKPHPDFRIFMVMDPRNGEISRAMRNRAVEICLLDSEQKPLPLMDLQAILDHIGISKYNHQRALLNIHDEMKSLSIGFEAITTNHLIQAATLTVQLAIRGQSIHESLHSACSDVYIRSRNLTIDQQEKSTQMMSEIFKLQDKYLTATEPHIRDSLDTRLATLNTLDLQENSGLAQLLQKSVLFSTTLKLSNKKVEGRLLTLRDVFSDDLGEKASALWDKKLIDVLPHVLLTLVCSVSENDVTLRENLLLSLIPPVTDFSGSEFLFELMKKLMVTVKDSISRNCLNSLEGDIRQDLCWDLRRISSWFVDSDKCDYENKTIVLLHYIMHRFTHWGDLEEGSSKNVKNMTVLQFSSAHNKGKVTNASVSCPEVLALSQFLEALDQQASQLLDSSASLSDDQCCQLITAFLWIHRLRQVGQRKLFVASSRQLQVYEEVPVLLGLHINWVRKWLLPVLSRLLTRHAKRGETGKLPQEVIELCAHVSGSQPARAVSRRVRGIMGQPLPVSNQQQAQLLLTIARLDDIIDLAKPEQKKESIQKKVEYLLSDSGKNMRSLLTKAFQSALSVDDISEVTGQISEMESEMPEFGLSLSEASKEATVRRHSSLWDCDVPLWPLRGVIALRALSACLHDPSPRLEECVHGMPLVLPSQLNGPRIRLLTESPPVTNPRPWLRWGSLHQPQEGEEQDYFPDERRSQGNYAYPLQCPLFSLYATALLFPDSCDLATLRSHQRRATMLHAVSLIAWTSAPALASSTLCYRKNETESIKSCFNKFMQSLKEAVKSKLENYEVPTGEKHNIFSLLEKMVEDHCVNFKNKDLPLDVETILTDMIHHIQGVTIMFTKMKCASTDKGNWRLIGLAWTHLGLLQLKLFSLQDRVDPVHKNSLKLQYCREEREELERMLASEQAQALILGSNRFPLNSPFTARVQQLLEKEKRLAKSVALRPTPNVYNSLYNEIQQLMYVVVRFIDSMSGAICGPNRYSAVTEAQTRLTSIHVAMDGLTKRYGVWYPDVVEPIVNAMAQMSHGLTLLIGFATSQIFHSSLDLKVPLGNLLRQLVSFPLPTSASVIDLCKLFSSYQITNLIKKNNTTCDEFNLARCSLQELLNVVSVSGRVRDQQWDMVSQLLDYLVNSWRKQEEARTQQQLQESSFFINKPRKIENLTEEEEDAIEMSKLFPMYKDKDFADLEPPSLDQKKQIVSEDDDSDLKFKLTIENILQVHKVHSAIVTKNTKAHWLHPAEKEVLDFCTPFAERFTLFSRLLDTLFLGCDYEMDSAVAPALCVGLHLARTNKIEQSRRQNKHYDFYHDPNPNEVKTCIPVLNSVTKRVFELLEEWPEHPTLNQITLVIDRILEFPATSPVSRFLVGLELLLAKLKEWEENAHSGVTLGPHAAAVTRLVLDWRRMELSEWKGCLESARRRLCEETVSRWWFHLYSLSRPDFSGDSNQLASALEQFMESSNMAEFQTRLDMLYTFHCHCVNSKLKMQSNVMWNVNKYYSQFSRVIARRMKELSQPVEKKLRDYVKIARWNDINYWAVKQTIHKTHHTLMKYIREYEGILKQPARSAMTRFEPVNFQPASSHVNFAHFIAPNSYGQTEPESSEWAEKEGEEEGSLLSRERPLFWRARRLCRESMKSCSLPGRIHAIGLMIEDLQDTSTLLNTEDVDRTESKEKQKSAARSILHRKRKALTDVFHSLSGLGLSYRAGLVVVGAAEGEGQGAAFTLHSPIDIQAALTQLDSRPADRELLSAWTGCEEHFLLVVARLAQLKTALSHPHKDLGPAIIERCKGFSNHLMSLCHDQKKSMTDSVSNLYVLRCLLKQLTSISPIQNKVTGLIEFKNELRTVTEDVIFVLAQFEVLLDACPALPSISEADKYQIPSIPHGAEETFYHGDENWTKVKSKLSSTIQSATKSKAQLEEKDKFNQFLKDIQMTTGAENLDVLTDEHIESLNEAVESLNSVQLDICEIKSYFKMESEYDTNPMVVSLNAVLENITECLKNAQILQTIFEDLNPGQLEDMVNSPIEMVLKKVLFSVQEFYKSYVKTDQTNIESKEEIENDQEYEETILLDSHLKEKIVAELKKALEHIQLEEVIKGLNNILVNCCGGYENIQRVKRCLPLLHQFSLLAQFVITQQVSALNTTSRLSSNVMSLFVDLANKGFLVPEELIEEEEGEGMETSAGGLGLGEGEGQKDVSDQIESQDQLEDAKKPGEHDQEEDKDCKEEEKGIEMSDDFGGKLQDMDKKEDDNGSGEDSGDEDEPDKEMGDTDKGAETLDQQIWGGSESEDEEEEEGSGDKEEEQGDRGEQISEKEMGAKDDDKTPQPDNDNNEGKEEKKEKKQEINEMEEPEVDDDQVDPYHGKNQPQPEPEALDLPDDLQLDDGDPQDKEPEGDEENPFDIDTMKEPNLPEEEEGADDNNGPTEKETDKENDAEMDSSDEEEEGEGENQGQEGMDVDEDMGEKQEEDKSADDGGAKDEDKTGEEPKMEEERKDGEEEAKPSEDLPASEPVPSANKDSGSKDQVNQPAGEDQSQELAAEEGGSEGREEQGVGAAENQQEAKRGGRGQSSQAVTAKAPETREQRRDRPGDSDEQRALGDVEEPKNKKLKTVNMNKDDQTTDQNNDEEGIQEDESAEIYQHIKEAKERSKYDAQTLDAATEEQASEQKLPNKEDDVEAEELQDDNDMNMDQDEPETETENITTVNPEKLKDVNDEKSEGAKKQPADAERGDGNDKMEVDGELIETLTVARGNESTFHTKIEDEDELTANASASDVDAIRLELEQQLATWSQPPLDDEAARAWERLTTITAELSRELSEQLRLVLEPTHASRLRGDFRTGKRINMRKVIPYIASQFRKDKIWMRRTKPAKREYQIVLAIDDSSSMADNHSKELAFESLAVVSRALGLLEAGHLSVLSFGDRTRILHHLGEPFDDRSGARLLQQFSFEQQKTQVGALVNFACGLFERVPARQGVTDVARLLVIVSDGRGVLNDGEEVVRQAVRLAKDMRIFMVFVIIDNPQSKDSILDIRLPKFSGGKLLGIVPYMDSFPFPFYLILRDINSLPSVLSDALRQWFELVTTL